MKKSIINIFLIVILLVMSGCIKKTEEEPIIKDEVSFSKFIDDLINYKKSLPTTKGVAATMIMEGIYVKDGVTYNYYSITKLEVMTFAERSKLFYDIEEKPESIYIVIANKLKNFVEYDSILDVVENGCDASDGIGVCTEVYNVENGKIVCSDGGSLVAIQVSNAPTKLNYILGTVDIDLTGLKVIGTYIDGTKKEETITLENITGFDTSTVGIKTITITILGRKSTFLIRVEEAVLVSIEVTKMPTKTVYVAGEMIDCSGIEIMGTMSDESKKELYIAAAYVSGFNSYVVGDQIVKITIGEKSTTITLKVIAKVLNSIAITTSPTKTSYYVGDASINLTGLVVTGTYNNGTTKAETISAYNISGFSTTTSGSKTITVTVGGKTATFPITVLDVLLNNIAITTAPTKTSYYVGDSTINLTGLVVTGTYNNGTTKAETITTANISGFVTTTSGSKTITVTVNGKTATFPITVTDVLLNSIAITTSPTKTNYYVGDSTINLTGLVVTGTYNNGTTKAETISAYNISGFVTTTSGSKTITVTVGGKTVTFPIIVTDAIKNASFLLNRNIDILKLKQYSASFEVADSSITTLVLTADGGIAPGQLTISGTSATLSKLVLDASVTQISVKALDVSGNQVGIIKTITLN